MAYPERSLSSFRNNLACHRLRELPENLIDRCSQGTSARRPAATDPEEHDYGFPGETETAVQAFLRLLDPLDVDRRKHLRRPLCHPVHQEGDSGHGLETQPQTGRLQPDPLNQTSAVNKVDLA